MIATREVHADGWRVRLGLARQVLRLESPEAVDEDPRRRRRSGTPLSPVLPLSERGPVSAATLLLKAKQFDDRLYAAVDLAAQQGAGRFAGKAALLRSLAATLAAGLPGTGIDAATAIHTACDLGGVSVTVPEALAETVRRAKADFLGNERLSKPLGFYTWTPDLSAIFLQDRFLQQPLDPVPADDLNRALEQTPGASANYSACIRLNERLTNPAKKLGPLDAGKRPPLFPPSRSHEVTLLEELFGDSPLPEGFDLMGELIRRVRSGEVKLEPTTGSGWYDHQAWALEPLLVPDRMPEAARLELGHRYCKHLEDLFRGALALTRETHVKQAGWGAGGGRSRRPILIRPDLTIEPLPTLYARRATGYRFIRSVLEEAFGQTGLREMHRLAPDGASRGGLAEELAWIEQLFDGAAVTARRELGMDPERGEAAVRCFSVWRADLGSDPDLSRDARMMVPVFFDLLRRKMKVWAFLGWRTIAVDVEYRVPPKILAVESVTGSGEPPSVLFSGSRYELAAPVMAEVYVERLLDRDEFRRHCDRFGTKDAILANLK